MQVTKFWRGRREAPWGGGSSPRNDDDARLTHHSRAMRGTLGQFFRRRGVSSEDAEDLVQEVFLRVARRGDLSSVVNLDAYLTSAAGSVLIDWRRRRAVREADAHIPFDVEKHDDTVPPPEQGAMASEALARTSLHLMELPERTRTIFLLCRLDGLSHRDIAVRLDISTSAVEKHVFKAMQHLMKRAGEE